MQTIRSLLFSFTIVIVFIFLLLALLIFAFSRPMRGVALRSWAWCGMRLLKLLCGLDYQIIGRENIIQDTNYIIFCKHQSAWETIGLQDIFAQPVTWVAKRSLLWLPLFGWCFWLSRPITINRKAGKQAIQQIKQQGKAKLDAGEKVVIFPEGTRIEYGKMGEFKRGGSILAKHAQYPILPIAHNAGKFWHRRGVFKYPGTITVKIGELINVEGKSSKQINQEAKIWIEQAMTEID